MSQLKIDSASAEEDMVIAGPSHNGALGYAIDLFRKSVGARYVDTIS